MTARLLHSGSTAPSPGESAKTAASARTNRLRLPFAACAGAATYFSRPSVLVTAGICWLLLIGAGMSALTVYTNTPSENVQAAALRHWPNESRLKLPRNRKALLVFAHPKCPCTRATLGELERIIARSVKVPALQIVVTKPVGAGSDWEKTDIVEKARAIPQAQVFIDDGAAETRRFGVSASGQALLFHESGRLMFRGGITAARGHAGDNPGESAIIAMLNGNEASQSASAVFGCSLLGKAGRTR